MYDETRRSSPKVQIISCGAPRRPGDVQANTGVLVGRRRIIDLGDLVLADNGRGAENKKKESDNESNIKSSIASLVRRQRLGAP